MMCSVGLRRDSWVSGVTLGTRAGTRRCVWGGTLGNTGSTNSPLHYLTWLRTEAHISTYYLLLLVAKKGLALYVSHGFNPPASFQKKTIHSKSPPASSFPIFVSGPLLIPVPSNLHPHTGVCLSKSQWIARLLTSIVLGPCLKWLSVASVDGRKSSLTWPKQLVLPPAFLCCLQGSTHLVFLLALWLPLSISSGSSRSQPTGAGGCQAQSLACFLYPRWFLSASPGFVCILSIQWPAPTVTSSQTSSRPGVRRPHDIHFCILIRQLILIALWR